MFFLKSFKLKGSDLEGVCGAALKMGSHPSSYVHNSILYKACQLKLI